MNDKLAPPANPRSVGWWLRRNSRRTLARFKNVRAHRLLGLGIRAARLHLRSPAPRSTPPRDVRIVVSLSTIPSRLAHLRPALNSLLDQSEPADRIVLALPRYSAREARPYPEIATLKLPQGIDVLDCEDFGPATKFLPVLAAEPDAIVIVVDDDVIYPPKFIANLLAVHREQPGAALGYRGVLLKPGHAFVDLDHVFGSALTAPSRVDVLFGTWGYLLPPHALDLETGGGGEVAERLRWVDDVWLCGLLARRGIPRLVVPIDEIPIETANAGRRSLAGGPNKSGENDARAVKTFEADW